MIKTWTDLLPLLPELFLLGMTSVILIAGLYIDERRRGLVHFLATLTLVFTAILTLRDFAMGERVAVAGGMFIRDGMGDACSSCSSTCRRAIVFVYAKFYLRTHKLFVAEFYTWRCSRCSACAS
jgi:NADH-quinone oxidoreductase subunit N